MRKYRRNPPVIKRSWRWVVAEAATYNLVDVKSEAPIYHVEEPTQPIQGWMAMGKFPLDNYTKADRKAILEACMDRMASVPIDGVDVLIMFDEKGGKDLLVPFAATLERVYESEDQIWTIFHDAVDELGKVLDQFEIEDASTKRGRNWDLDLEPLPKVQHVVFKPPKYTKKVFTKLPETFRLNFGGERWAGMCGIALDPNDLSEETLKQLRKPPIGTTVWTKLPKDLDYLLLHEIGVLALTNVPWLLIEPNVVDWNQLPQEITKHFVAPIEEEDDNIYERFAKLEYNPRKKRR